ncbi:hypothetical protein [Melaminivora sp.]|uniref:hypothetical protein n=1 Tax=Melaminivora sp. TaxID=1933032 RepID=UPI0028B106AD|nr:hypothetical protein [Melaminivora sp.]
MQRALRVFLSLSACALGLPAGAQTQVWSEAPRTPVWSEAPHTQVRPEAPRTQRWSEAPAPAQPAPAPQSAPGQTRLWAVPTHTERRSDADIQRQVDSIVRSVERDTRAGRGASGGNAPASQVPDQVWRDHVDRTRAQQQWQREQDAHYERQRQFNPR